MKSYCLVVCLLAVWSLASFSAPAFAADDVKTVKLTIVYSEEKSQTYTLPFKAEMTVGDLMQLAAKAKPALFYKSRGSGETAFITAIGGVANEGLGDNWTYRVNGKLAKVSYAVQTLKANDQVQWKFGKFMPE